MNYLKKLKKFYQKIFLIDHDNLDSQDNFKISDVVEDEPLARFIFDRKHYTSQNKAKPAAFMPHPKHQDLSVFRTIHASNDLIVHLGESYVEPQRKKKILAWAILSSTIPLKHGLKLNPDGKPHKRHLNIENWPSTAKTDTVLWY